ncbi:MAG TPA: DUF1127 domain-containing protein [Bradyrhizobium sp.]
MPPQQTKLTSEPGRDAARLPFDFDIASVKGALSENETAGPPVASTRSVLRSLKGYWRAYRERRQRNRSRLSLHDLSDRQLRDIGLAQGDIDYIVAHRAFEELRDGTTYLWLSRGVM